MRRRAAFGVTTQLAKARWKLRPAREHAVRAIKRLRNLVADPPPRSKELLFEGFALSYPDVTFRFRLLGRTYVHRVILHEVSKETFDGLAGDEWAPLLHHIGLLFAPFHCLLTDLASVRSTCGPLSDDLRQLYEDLAVGGLAEFRYLWGLDPRRRVTFRSDVGTAVPPARKVPLHDKVLLLNGGGKDSIVAGELLGAMGIPYAWFTARPRAAQAKIIALSSSTESYSVGFEVDPAVNRDARYGWGHMPTTGLISSLSLIPAILHGFRFVTTGAEYSASFPTRRFRGMDINHQYGKSYAFEAQIAEAIDRRLVEGLRYFSVLRPFEELRLAALLSRFDRYLGSFISCNVGLSRGEWCKSCPKCAFVFLLLYPLLDAGQLDRVFGENLFHRPRIRAFMLEAAGIGRKPWECVGTPEESQLALALSLEKSPELIFPEWPHREDLARACATLDIPAAVEKYVHGFHEPHRVPPEFEARLRSVARALTPGRG
jgi:hypothetical protein